VNIVGTIYAADASLSFSGNGGVSNLGSQYVTLGLRITGNGNVGIAYYGPQVARVRILTLLEQRSAVQYGVWNAARPASRPGRGEAGCVPRL
jgi:hypothetical protein